MSRIQSQDGLSRSPSELRLGSNFTPVPRQIFSGREDFGVGALLASLQVGADFAAEASFRRRQATAEEQDAEYLRVQSELTPLLGQLQRISAEDPDATAKAEAVSEQITTLVGRAEQNPLLSQSQVVQLQQDNQTGLTRAFRLSEARSARVAQQTELAAQGMFLRAVDETTQVWTKQPEVVEDFLSTDRVQRPAEVYSYLYDSLPDDMRAYVEENPSAYSALVREAERMTAYVDQLDNERTEAANFQIREEALQGTTLKFAGDPSFTAADYISEQRLLGEGLEDAQQKLADDVVNIMRSSAYSDVQKLGLFSKIDNIRQELVGNPAALEDLDDGISAYHTSHGQRIVDQFQALLVDQPVDEGVLEQFDKFALQHLARTGLDVSDVSTVDQLASVGAGPNTQGLTKRLESYRRDLAQQVETKTTQLGELTEWMSGNRLTAPATNLYTQVLDKAPQEAVDLMIFDLTQQAQGLSEEELGIANQQLQVLYELQGKAGGFTFEELATAAEIGSELNGRRLAAGSTAPLDTVAQHHVDLLARGDSVGIRSVQGFLRGAGSAQGEYLFALREEDEAAAFALQRLSQEPDSLTGEELEQRYREYRDQYTAQQFVTGDQAVSLRQAVQAPEYQKTLRKQLDLPKFAGMSRNAELLLTSQTRVQGDDYEIQAVAAATSSRVRKLGYHAYVTDAGLLDFIRDTTGATPISQGVRTDRLAAAARRDTLLSRRLGGMVYSALGGSKRSGFLDEAIGDWLLDRTNLIEGSSDESRRKFVQENWRAGRIRPVFRYGEDGTELLAVVTDSESNVEFLEPIMTFHWGNNITAPEENYWAQPVTPAPRQEFDPGLMPG